MGRTAARCCPAQLYQHKERLIDPRPFAPRQRGRRDNVNQFIRAREVRVVFPDGKVEVLPTPVAVRQAKELDLDLVLVSPTADPPVAKIIDYGEWAYQQKKRQHEAKKKQHVMDLKEVKFRPNTDEHDYAFKRNHALRFLQEGNKVKATVAFRGREITHADLGRGLLEKLVAELGEQGTVEGRPRMEGRLMHVIISPKKSK
ncbi:MAG: translation initiation factor IF-3 [Acidobacteria bacterium]|nr:translation initiation factor IF-3 [Acidobacteriota bacterium]